MNGMLEFCVILLVQGYSLATTFYHEPSYITLTSSEDRGATADFGFSMGFQGGDEPSLVVGSPHSYPDGSVYSCPINRDLKPEDCKNLNINVKDLVRQDYDDKKDNNFCLGAAIATTPNYFMTCAPLWTTSVLEINTTVGGSYGTCFVYSKQNTVHRFIGILEQYKSTGKPPYGALYGGVGWSILADPDNQMILLSKQYKFGDIQYVNGSDLEKNKDRKSLSMHFPNGLRQKDFVYHFNSNNYPLVGQAFAAGKFFTPPASYRPTLYAFTATDSSHIGHVNFLGYHTEKNTMMYLEVPGNSGTDLRSNIPGDMYGTALWSTNLDTDEFTDLLVGAPAHSLPGRSEVGAIYIYLGRDINKISTVPFLTIYSEKARSRFGTAITSTDLDGDAWPEIFVSAPYEDLGAGALYIISGYEIFEPMKKHSYMKLKLSDFKFTQRIQITEFQSLGFSLQVIPDIDNNGCDEVAVGTPRNASVVLFRCIPTVNIQLSVEPPTQEVKANDDHYTVKVCVDVKFNKPDNVTSTKFKVIYDVQGNEAKLEKNYSDVDLAKNLKNNPVCEDVTVFLPRNVIGSYYFSAKLDYADKTVFEQQEFDPSWARIATYYSKLDASHTQGRACINDDCTPKLHMDILWNGQEPPSDLRVDELTRHNVTLRVTNHGAHAFGACVRFKVTGVNERVKCRWTSDDGEYECNLPNPLAKDGVYPIDFTVDIARHIDLIHIKADFYNNCNSKESIPAGEVKIKLTFVVKNVYILDGSHDVNVTESQITDLKSRPTIVDTHRYEIINNGTLNWENVDAIITINKKDFIKSYIITGKEKDCVESNYTAGAVKFLCSGMKLYNMKPANNLLIAVRMEILREKILENLVDGKLEIGSDIQVRMMSSNSSDNLLVKRQVTTIHYVKEKSLANNGTAIIIIVVTIALLILIAIVCILFKIGFFERKEKDRLDSLKASVRRKSESAGPKPSTSAADAPRPDSKESIEDFDIEVIDDCAFEPVSNTTTDDNAALITKDENEFSNIRSTIKKRHKSSTHAEERATRQDTSNTTSSTTGEVPGTGGQ